MTVKSTQYVPSLNVLVQSYGLMPEMEIRLVVEHKQYTIDLYDNDAEDVVDSFDFDSKQEAACYARELKAELRGIGHKVRIVNM